MPNSTETMLPAGWYVNETDRSSLRWWSGGSWTDRTMPLPITEPTAIIPPAATQEWEERPWSTLSVWVIIMSPVLVGAALLLAMLEANASGFTWQVAALLAAPHLITLVFAPLDELGLRRAGHRRTSTWAWAVLGAPVYLVTRTVVLNRYARGGAALWMWLVALLLTVIAAFALLLTTTAGIDFNGVLGSFTYSSLGSVFP